MKFSVCLIARNEALTLPRIVASLKEFQEKGGEILVLDTNSTDNTVEVAKSLGCIVHEVGDKFRIQIDEDLAQKINERFVVEGEAPVVSAGESLFDFASARNYIADFASNDMIATPDCDEIYTKLDLDTINQEIENGVEQFTYEFVFSHDSNGNPIIKFQHSKFYNRKKMKWVGVVHEVLQGQVNQKYLHEGIIKLEHYQNVATNRAGYLKGLAVDCFQNPDNDRNSHYFAREMFYHGRNKSAIKEFLRHIEMNKWPTEASQSMLYIGDAYKALGDFDNMLLWYVKSVDKEARREPLMRMAEYYFSKNMHNQVIVYAEAALAIKQLPFYSNHQPYYEHIPHELLYTSYWWAGDREKSKYHYFKALAFYPNNPKYIDDGKFYGVKTRLDIYGDFIKNNQNFTFIKRGDGELACMEGEQGANCDAHPYSEELGTKLKESFEYLKDNSDIVEWDDQKNYNTFLHRTDNDLEKLREFWMAVKDSKRKKYFVGPERLEGVIKMLNVDEFVKVPLVNAFSYLKGSLFTTPEDNSIWIFSCGMPAKWLIAELKKMNPDITCIDAGSSFDPIFIGQTRTVQVEKEKLEDLYFNSYTEVGIEGMMYPDELDWLYKTSKSVDTFLEIGSFKGKSTHAILTSGCKKVYAVDHFVGSSDPIEVGNNDTYEDFMANVGHFENLEVKRMSSLEAAKDFEDKSLDVVFIDGGHRIQEITEDIVAWLPKTKKILCGHDYNDVKAVKLSVDALLGPVQSCGRIWYKVLDGTETLDMDKANKLARYLDMDLVNKMFSIPQDTHPERLFKLANISDDDKLIYDLGCSVFKTVDRAIGIDIENKPGVDIVSSVDELPIIQNDSVDIILASHILEHMADTNKTLKEWKRILKPGGKIVFVLPDDEFINTLDPVLSGGVHLQAFTRDSLKELVESIPQLKLESVETVVENWSFGGVIVKEEYPTISFVIPTMGREPGLTKCIDSIKALNYPQDKIEIIVKKDSMEDRIGLPKNLKLGVEESTGDWVVFAADDTEFDKDCINEALHVGKGGYVSLNTCIVSADEGNINEHFMIRRDIIEKIGEVFDTEFYHVGVDNLLWAKMKKKGIAVRCDKAILHHNHWTQGAPMDDIYKVAWNEERVNHDRALLAKKLQEL